MLEFPNLDNFLKTALEEDLGQGDITSRACVAEGMISHGRFIAKEAGVLCGLPFVRRVFALLDPTIDFYPEVNEGDKLAVGDQIATIAGNSRAILAGERVALNLMQHLSGIASATTEAVREIRGTGAKICDTRKTIPGLRSVQKYAVRIGGGVNHRYNLADAVLIKDNHIVAAGGILAAIEAARRTIPHTMKIEVETETLLGVAEALEAGADIIMLDNMDTQTMIESVRLIAGRAVTEASGNITIRRLRAVADTGVDYISMGALTHHVRALDISLCFEDRP